MKEETAHDHACGIEVEGQAPRLKCMYIARGQLTRKRLHVGSMKEVKRRKVCWNIGDKQGIDWYNDANPSRSCQEKPGPLQARTDHTVRMIADAGLYWYLWRVHMCLPFAPVQEVLLPFLLIALKGINRVSKCLPILYIPMSQHEDDGMLTFFATDFQLCYSDIHNEQSLLLPS